MIHATGLTKLQSGKPLYKNAQFQINSGEKIGLVGPNGAGKTTIFRLIVGEELADEGKITRVGDIEVSYFSQTIAEVRGRTVLEETLSGAGKVAKVAKRLKELETLITDAADPDSPNTDQMDLFLSEFGELQSYFENHGGYDLDSRAESILTGLGFPPEEHGRPVESYSGGWKMRIALAKCILSQPDVLLMDEPTNHLDLESILWLEKWLKSFKGALLMTSHDREFMNRSVQKILSVESGKIELYSGNYDFYEKERQIRRTQQQASFERQQDMLAKEEEFIARFAARASHAAQVQSRVKKLEKIERIEAPQDERKIKFEFQKPPRSGQDVVRFEKISKIYQDSNQKQKKVFENLSGLVRRLDRIAVVGVNGAGKSTFLKTLAGQIEPTSGTVQIGPSVNLGYFSQHSLDILNPNLSIQKEIESVIPDANIGFIRNLLAAFNFNGDDVEKPIRVLSGGEKSRVVLATLLARPINFLVLDEPTNHLDIASREVLLNALKDFEGTVLMVSHDRYFLRALANRVFEIHHGQLMEYPGKYSEYLDHKEKDSF